MERGRCRQPRMGSAVARREAVPTTGRDARGDGSRARACGLLPSGPASRRAGGGPGGTARLGEPQAGAASPAPSTRASAHPAAHSPGSRCGRAAALLAAQAPARAADLAAKPRARAAVPARARPRRPRRIARRGGRASGRERDRGRVRHRTRLARLARPASGAAQRGSGGGGGRRRRRRLAARLEGRCSAPVRGSRRWRLPGRVVRGHPARRGRRPGLPRLSRLAPRRRAQPRGRGKRTRNGAGDRGPDRAGRERRRRARPSRAAPPPRPLVAQASAPRAARRPARTSSLAGARARSAGRGVRHARMGAGRGAGRPARARRRLTGGRLAVLGRAVCRAARARPAARATRARGPARRPDRDDRAAVCVRADSASRRRRAAGELAMPPASRARGTPERPASTPRLQSRGGRCPIRSPAS